MVAVLSLGSGIGFTVLQIYNYVDITTSTHMKLYNTAYKYIGLGERDKDRKLDRLLGINTRSTPWCAAFVNHVLEENGIKGTGSLAARSFLGWGHAVEKPERGDIVVFNEGGWHGHVSFVYEVNQKEGTITVLGGNQDDMVKFKTYNLRNVIAYRRGL